MDFKNARWRELSDSKAYEQWETIMLNSGWFENQLKNGGFSNNNMNKYVNNNKNLLSLFSCLSNF